VDPNVAMFDIQTQDQLIADSFLLEGLLAQASTAFGGVVLFLAAIGLYGVMSNSVTGRTREIGIRIALGAQRWQVVRTVMRGTIWIVLVGITLGLAGGLAASRLTERFLFGLSPYDPLTIAGVVLVMGVTAALAAYLPTRRAARMDPTVALRSE
jgi:ABC-type antimicrobial peptide transport system permease subunit